MNEIPKQCKQMPFINKGSSGEIYGSFIFRGITCVCESIMHDPTTVASATEDEVCGLGKRWMGLDHRNVMKFHGVLFQTPALYVVMDFAVGGSVRRALDSCPNDLDVIVVKDWAMQIADGMNYLHSKEIVHGNLKAAQSEL